MNSKRRKSLTKKNYGHWENSVYTSHNNGHKRSITNTCRVPHPMFVLTRPSAKMCSQCAHSHSHKDFSIMKILLFFDCSAFWIERKIESNTRTDTHTPTKSILTSVKMRIKIWQMKWFSFCVWDHLTSLLVKMTLIDDLSKQRK